MDIANMLSLDGQASSTARAPAETNRQPRPYATRRSSAIPAEDFSPKMSPSKAASPNPRKAVFFWLVVTAEGDQYARLPLNVHLQPRDDTQSIIQTVKNFFGLPERGGISFQDQDGLTLIPRYDNFINDSSPDPIHVRVIQEPRRGRKGFTVPSSPDTPQLDGPFEMQPPFHNSRSASQAARRASLSPAPGPSRPGVLARAASNAQTTAGKSFDRSADYEAANGFSGSEAGSVSVSSSRRDHLASAEISVNNIVEGNRRKRAKFESSELPLFNPPQIPMSASMSSASPQRRWNGPNVNTPITTSNQQTFSYNQMMPSPLSYSNGDRSTVKSGYGLPAGASKPFGSQLRGPSLGSALPQRFHGANNRGDLPTPAPTIGSAMSDEDVAIQLMRLGDTSNLSHGRTSTSTVDDALSGKAEVASSAGASDNESEEAGTGILPRMAASSRAAGTRVGSNKRKLSKIDTDLPSAGSVYTSGEEYEDDRDGSFKGNSDEIRPQAAFASQSRSKSASGKSKSSRKSSVTTMGRTKTSTTSKSRQQQTPKIPPSPYSLPPSNREDSNASSLNYQSQLGVDDDDLSAMPRCQRCRKSKKGCDRQRPCGRCSEAGIGIEGCISEDEGNGRKGRFGRHMGVVAKKTSLDSMSPTGQDLSVAAPEYSQSADGSKRRKR